MKLILTNDASEVIQKWNLDDIGDMRLRLSRRKLYRELIEEIDHRLRFSPPLPEVKQEVPTPDELIKFLAGLTQEERERILK